MVTIPSKPELKNIPISLENLYREGHTVPAALYRYTQQLFNKPAYSKTFSKARELAYKLDSDLKKYAELHSNPKKTFTATPNYFLLHRDKLAPEDIEIFHHGLSSLLKKTSHIVYKLTPQQFAAIQPELDIYVRNANDQLMIYLHGNQILTGAPVIIGGYPHLDYFQWGNLYGVIKYEEQEGEEVYEANLMIYFEDMHDRKLEQCLHDLLLKLQQEAQPAPQPQPQKKLDPSEEKSTAPQFGFGMVPPQGNETEK